MAFGMLTAFDSSPMNDDHSSRDRNRIDEQFKWNLKDLYNDNAAWYSDKTDIAAKFKKVGELNGKIVNTSGDLLKSLNYIFRVQKDLVKLSVYANLLSDQDTRES